MELNVVETGKFFGLPYFLSAIRAELGAQGLGAAFGAGSHARLNHFCATLRAELCSSRGYRVTAWALGGGHFLRLADGFGDTIQGVAQPESGREPLDGGPGLRPARLGNVTLPWA